MQCKQCGEIITEDMLFCGNCGCPVSYGPEAETVAFCPECGSPVEPGDVFCGECGYRFAEEHSAGPTVYDPPEPIIHEPSPGIIKKRMEPKENPADTEKYREGRKYLKIAGDFE